MITALFSMLLEIKSGYRQYYYTQNRLLYSNFLFFGLQRSASLLNLNLPNLTKFASNIKRKMSDHQHIVLQTPKSNCRPNSHTNSSSNSTSTSSSSSCGITTPLTSRQSHFDTSSIRSKTKSGVLYIYLKSRRALQVRTYFQYFFLKIQQIISVELYN